MEEKGDNELRPPAQSKPSQYGNASGKSGRLNNDQSIHFQEYQEQQERSYKAAAERSPPRSCNATPSYTTTSVQSTLHQTEIVSSSYSSTTAKGPGTSASQANYISKYG